VRRPAERAAARGPGTTDSKITVERLVTSGRARYTGRTFLVAAACIDAGREEVQFFSSFSRNELRRT